jgi:predicted Zn finger-like uncharacterized protein
MRLTCPNCSARYEVDDSMIPPEGRDVQCSNCATTWFQPGRRSDRRPTSVQVARGAAAQTDPAAAEAGPDERSQDADASADAAPAGRPRPSQDLDPALREILREEAEREAQLRRAAAVPDPVETQEEFALDPADPPIEGRLRAEIAAAQAAADRGVSEAPEPAPEPEPPISRRDLLPDIEELNSSLRDTGDRSGAEDSTTDIDALEHGPQRRRGMRLGFLSVLAVAAGAVAIYVNADRLADAVPAAAAPLAGYVDAVDGLRIWLDGVVRDLAGGGNGNGA